MANNVQITPGAGATVETIDEGSGVERQVVALGSIGKAGSETQLTGGQKTSANSIPVVLASDQSVLSVSGTITANAGTNLNTSTLALETGGNLATLAGAVSSSKVQTKEVRSSTGTQSSVASSASDSTILASNASRLGAIIYNDSTQVLYLLLASGTSSSSAYSVQLAAKDYYEVPALYTGVIKGIWASTNGNARVTEFS